LQCSPRGGHVFSFCNAQRHRLKLLVWDGSGLRVCAKKIIAGKISLATAARGRSQSGTES
jgi:transposase